MNHDNKLYHTAFRKMIAWSVAAIVVVSISFYIPTYFVAVKQLDKVRAQLIEATGTDAQGLIAQHNRTQTAHGNVRLNLAMALAVTQGTVLLLGAAGSFFFARRVLRPIQKAHLAQASFAANANHQIRTPVAIMKAELEGAALRADYSPQTTKRVYASISEELDRLQAITEQLLEQSRTPAAGRSLCTAATPARQLAKFGQRLAAVHHVELTCEVPKSANLPFSRQELYMILDILLDNSKKYAGVLKVRAALQLEKKQRQIEFQYTDNGHGIEPEALKRILARGERGPSAERNTPGSGLGLSILTDLVENHGGVVHITSSNQGAQFSFSVPVKSVPVKALLKR